MTNNVNTQPDYIALAIVAVLAVIVIVMVIRKWLSERNAPKVQIEEIKTEQSTAVAPGSAGRIKLNNVDPRTAAMVMAITADKMGKPLNELRFISIKEVEE